MNKLRAEALAYAQALSTSSVVRAEDIQPFVIPPFPYIADVAKAFAGTKILTGAQNMHWSDQGAWTGEVSGPMLTEVGAQLVELGHSERRTYFGETDETVGKKVVSAVKAGLIPLVCIGDTQQEHEAGATTAVLSRQVHYALQGLKTEDIGKVRFAYEPVWSIGEGGTPADPLFVNRELRKLKELTAMIAGEPLLMLYGGSVNAANCVELASCSHVDGLFIGRAAWDATGFIEIINLVQNSRV